jgi:hypothetical protein
VRTTGRRRKGKKQRLEGKEGEDFFPFLKYKLFFTTVAGDSNEPRIRYSSLIH